MLTKEQIQKAITWHEVRSRQTTMPGTAGMHKIAVEVLREKADNGSQVELVRCRECKHRILTGRTPFMYYFCTHPKGLKDNLQENDFCSYGEKEEKHE